MERYSDKKQIGRGAFGSVYKVINLNGDTIALKIVEIKNQRMGEEAKKEVTLLEKISLPDCFPSLVCYFKSFIQNSTIYIEMEYIDGPSLHTFAEKNRNKANFPKNLIAIIGDLTPGLIYLHSKGIIHRDIKPENIMIKKTNLQPKLIDIGLGCLYKKNLSCYNASQECCFGKDGTPYFMAPETLLDRVAYPESDIWSLGASIYFAATDTHVFEPKIETYKSIIEKAKEPISLKSTKNIKLDTLIKLMTERNVYERINENEILSFIKN